MDHPQVTRSRRLFSLTTRVDVHIRAPGHRVWKLLTDAPGFPRWNSTVSRVEGEIREGAGLVLYVRGTARTFRPRVSGLVPDERMTWTGGLQPLLRDVRTFVLRPCHDGSTDFAMEGRLTGFLLPLARMALSDVGRSFERTAEDLKRAAEREAAPDGPLG
jgi:hypothetical protein